MYILGISAFYHDSAACLIRGGKVVAAAQEERFSRKKHDCSFPEKAVEYCLNYAKISGSELGYVAFYDKPFLKFDRLLESYLARAPKGMRSFIQSMPQWISRDLWIKDILKKKIGYKGNVIFPEHHESHAASAFFPSPFNEAAFLTVDGAGEWTTSSYGIGRGNKIEIIADMKFPHSLGLLYSAFTYYTGFKVNSGEFKVMCLAPYGEPKYKDLILSELLDLKEDGSFKLNMKYFNYAAGLAVTNGKFDKLFGHKPRKPEGEITQFEMDLARSVQDVTGEVMLRMGHHVHRETGLKKLCLAGGIALNCAANGKLLSEGPFEDIWIQPAADDAGGALGAAFFVWHQYLSKQRTADEVNDLQSGSYLGPEYSGDEILEFLDNSSIPYERLSASDIPDRVSDLINDEKVIGWFQGRMEFGPCALGARSIIGDARSAKMQSMMNLKIKFRESSGPFAASVLSDMACGYFEINRPSPYMLLTANVKDEHRCEMTEEERKLLGISRLKIVRSGIPAVTHVDYSARIQTVHKETNPLYYETISRFYEKYGCPVIVNASFNVRGEPMVCTPEDAYGCFMRTDMDYLLMGNFLLNKQEQKSLTVSADLKKEFEPD